MSVVFLTAVFGFASLQVDKFQNARPMIAAIRADWAAEKGTVRRRSPPTNSSARARSSMRAIR